MSNTSITLTERFETFANAQVKSGRYGSVSEVIRAGLRILEEREIKMEALRAALAEGETSGRADYSIAKLTAELDK
jgi:antitoxin ParD1/3/4